ASSSSIRNHSSAGIAPHRHGGTVGQRCISRARRQIDLGEGDAGSEEENRYRQDRCLQSFEIVGSHLCSSPQLVRLVDLKFPGINQHHHHHSAGENIVGGDFALVVRVPHESKARFAAGGIGNGAGGRRGASAAAVGSIGLGAVGAEATSRASGRVGTEI